MGSQSGQEANRTATRVHLRDRFGHSLCAELRNEVEVPRLYVEEKLSLKQIAVRQGISRVLVRRLLREAGIEPEPKRRTLDLTGQTPFGWKRDRDRLVPHVAEQRIITRMEEARRNGLSLHGIARAFIAEGVGTKNGGRWHAKSVSQILKCNARLLSEHERQVRKGADLNP